VDLYLCEPVGPFHTGPRVTNTFTTKQDVTPAPVPVIPAGKLRAGSKVHVRASGDYSTTGTPNLTMGFWYGTRALAITGDLALSSVIVTPSGAAAWPWWMEWDGLCTATGTAGTLVGQGQLQMGASLSTFNAEIPLPITAALRTVSTFDTTIERALGVSATWGTSSASNQITVNNHRVLILN
jgi:hypothetical protein